MMPMVPGTLNDGQRVSETAALVRIGTNTNGLPQLQTWAGSDWSRSRAFTSSAAASDPESSSSTFFAAGASSSQFDPYEVGSTSTGTSPTPSSRISFAAGPPLPSTT